MTKKLIGVSVLSALLGFVGPAQQPDKSDKPVLIREPENKEEKPPADEFSPFLAEKSVEVGNYYFKKKRYAAAISRYLDAIKYKPNYTDAYKLLAKTYEVTNNKADAINTYAKYLAQYPRSESADEFKQEIKRLKQQQQKASKGR